MRRYALHAGGGSAAAAQAAACRFARLLEDGRSTAAAGIGPRRLGRMHRRPRHEAPKKEPVLEKGGKEPI